MNKILKYLGIGIGTLVCLLVIAAVSIGLSTGIRLSRTYAVNPERLVIPEDGAAVAEGRRLAGIHCTTCHGEDMAGDILFQDPGLGKAMASNLTPGLGGVGADYSDEDWVRAIRHGIGADGKSLFIMPSNDYWYLSDRDLSNLVAYLKSLPPVNNEVDELELTPLARLFVGAGAFGPVIRAEAIDHDRARPPAPEPGMTAEYGEYLVNISSCRTCHGENLSGGKDPNPEAPPGPNLTPGGALRVWTVSGFINFMRTGVTLSGYRRDPKYMPWKSLGKMNDIELTAIFLYLRSLPALETTSP